MYTTIVHALTYAYMHSNSMLPKLALLGPVAKTIWHSWGIHVTLLTCLPLAAETSTVSCPVVLPQV
jgi:hypothetical protein